jgi:hypothetical protein
MKLTMAYNMIDRANIIRVGRQDAFQAQRCYRMRLRNDRLLRFGCNSILRIIYTRYYTI